MPASAWCGRRQMSFMLRSLSRGKNVRTETLAIVRDVISEVGDLFLGHLAHHVGHGAIIAMTRVVLVFGKRLVEIILALIGKPRNILLAGKIGVVTAAAAMLLRERQSLLHPCGVAGFRRRLRLRQLGDEIGKLLEI